MTVTTLDNISVLDLKNFDMETLLIESKALKGNSLQDPTLRRNPILIPRNAEGPLPVVFYLSGLTGNGSGPFSPKFGEPTNIELLDAAITAKKAPKALYVFVDAMTSWGGSQFVNSRQGNYEDYLIKELVPAIHSKYDVSLLPKHWCVTGGSSGGYGSLHLASKFPKVFGVAAAIAPDCFFEAALLGEIYESLTDWNEYGGLKGLLKELREGRLRRSKNFHTLVNVVGMSLCYADGELPMDTHTGKMKPAIWKKWLAMDPLVFFPKRAQNLRKLHALYIDVGNRDQFKLHLGCRQLHQWLKSRKIKHHYSEFKGTHFEIGTRRPEVWSWLQKIWD
ncbi:alpha/beta hydrolase-fold protein [Bdellovibrio sp. HCB337]|uniref:alpha/beta hydrolase-fold protein n=1 Tax=Bdellovibrio sp. HCB337 TaxID=3394358 RepID=UPI0039A4424A